MANVPKKACWANETEINKWTKHKEAYDNIKNRQIPLQQSSLDIIQSIFCTVALYQLPDW
jgi:hypothetical protein